MEDEGPMVKIKGTQAEQKVKLKERVETLDKALKHKITNLDGYDHKVIEIQTLMFKVPSCDRMVIIARKSFVLI